MCVADAGSPCGAGTVLDGGTCIFVPGGSAQYWIRVVSNQVIADGVSPVPVEIIGTNPDGTPATDAVVLSLTVPSAGALSPMEQQLTATGGLAHLTPCNSETDAICSGDFQIALALQSAPDIIVATSEVLSLVNQTGVGSPAECLVGGNVLFINDDAQDGLLPGQHIIRQADWTSFAYPSQEELKLTGLSADDGYDWDLLFLAPNMNPLAAQTYLDSEADPPLAGHPQLLVSGNRGGCTQCAGAFQIEELQVDAGVLYNFTATFEQHPFGEPPAARGCVHFEQP